MGRPPSEEQTLAFDSLYRSASLDRLEGRVDPGHTIRGETYREFGEKESAPEAAAGDFPSEIQTLAILSLGLPRVSIDVRSTVAPGSDAREWADPWLLAKRARAVDGPPATSPDLVVATLLGEGGMGQVALAEQRSLQRQVAIKSLKPEEQRRSAADALIHEGRILGALAHPNVVPIHALGVDDTDRPVLVLKRIEGVPWSDLIQDPDHPHWTATNHRGVDPLVRHLDLFLDVCNAVAFAHSLGIVHRDLKPENVMVGAYGEVYVLDWGLAARLADPDPDGRIVGTPNYMAPEMLDQGEFDLRTDVYLLGGILHEVLTGRPPHRGRTLHQVLLAAHLSEPADFPKEVPAPLAETCNRAMARLPCERFQDVPSLRDAVALYLIHRSSLLLAEAAGERLRELEALGGDSSAADRPPADHLHASRLFSECQFGYLQALREWPENARAKEGLERSIVQMCAIDLQHGQGRSAESLFAQLAAPPPWLTERLHQERRRIERLQRDTDSFRRMRRDLDFESGLAARLRFCAGLAILAGIVLIGHVLPASRIDDPHGYDFAVSTDAILLGVFVGLLAWQRRRLLDTRIDRMFFGVFSLSLALKFLLRLTAWHLGVELYASMAVDMLVQSVLCLIGGLTIRPWLHWAALICGLDFLAILIFPIAYQPIYAAGNAGGFLFFFGYLSVEFFRRTR